MEITKSMLDLIKQHINDVKEAADLIMRQSAEGSELYEEYDAVKMMYQAIEQIIDQYATDDTPDDNPTTDSEARLTALIQDVALDEGEFLLDYVILIAKNMEIDGEEATAETLYMSDHTTPWAARGLVAGGMEFLS